jgi:Protein of unknown function (DUF3237)
MPSLSNRFPACAVLLVVATSAAADGPTTQLQTEFLMTFVAPLDPETDVDSSLSISNVQTAGSWVSGPRIKGVLVPPGGDWLRVLPSGLMRIDVRTTIKTDDGALIYMSYNGVLQESPANVAKADRGETLTAKEIGYFVIAPTFETSSAKYSWLNGIQAVGKMAELKEGPGGYVKYDVFAIH